MNIKDLTLREKICQTAIVNGSGELFQKYGGYKEFFKKYPVGGIYLGGSIVGGKLLGTENMFEVTEKWNNYLKIPAIFCYSYEKNENEPHLMALGATGDKKIAYENGREKALCLKKQGIRLMLNPVADLALSIVAPINIRAIGDDPEKAAEMLVEIVKGASDEHVVATAKHFPGMGKEMMDTHLTKVSVMLTKEEWDKTYRVIYKKLIDNGLMAVMSAHLSLPCYQKERSQDGSYPVATESKEIITDLLKNDLGFKGVVVTDALTMGGIGVNTPQIAINAFAAGNDMLLCPDIEYVDLLEKKILNNEIPIERLDDALERIFRMKEFVQAEKSDQTDNYSEETSYKIAEKSLTLINNFNDLIPLDKKKIKKVLLITPAKDDVSCVKLSYLKEIFNEYGMEVIVRKDLWIPELKELEEQVGITVFAFFEGPTATPGPIMLNRENGASVWAAQNADKNKTIIASFGSPFLYSEYFKSFPTYINAYSPAKTSCRAFVKAIMGEINFEGSSPVKLL